MDPEVRDDILYPVLPGRPVILAVRSGFRQPSGTSLQLGTRTWSPEPGRLERGVVLADDGGRLRFAVLYTVTAVRDVRPDTDETAVTFRLEGGADGPLVAPYRLRARHHGGRARYLVNVHFV